MIYFYGICFILILISFFATAVGLAKPERFSMCAYQLAMLLTVIGLFIKEFQ